MGAMERVGCIGRAKKVPWYMQHQGEKPKQGTMTQGEDTLGWCSSLWMRTLRFKVPIFTKMSFLKMVKLYAKGLRKSYLT